MSGYAMPRFNDGSFSSFALLIDSFSESSSASQSSVPQDDSLSKKATTEDPALQGETLAVSPLKEVLTNGDVEGAEALLQPNVLQSISEGPNGTMTGSYNRRVVKFARRVIRSPRPAGDELVRCIDVVLAIFAASGFTTASSFDDFAGQDLFFLVTAAQTQAFLLGVHATANALELLLPYFLVPLFRTANGGSPCLAHDAPGAVAVLTQRIQTLRRTPFDAPRAAALGSSRVASIAADGVLALADPGSHWEELFRPDPTGVHGDSEYAGDVMSFSGGDTQDQTQMPHDGGIEYLDTQPPGGFDTETCCIFPELTTGSTPIYSYLLSGLDSFQDESVSTGPRMFEYAQLPLYIWFWLLYVQNSRAMPCDKLFLALKTRLVAWFDELTLRELPLTESCLNHVFGPQREHSPEASNILDRKLMSFFPEHGEELADEIVGACINLCVRATRIFYVPGDIPRSTLPTELLETMKAAGECKMTQPGVRYIQRFILDPNYSADEEQ